MRWRMDGPFRFNDCSWRHPSSGRRAAPQPHETTMDSAGDAANSAVVARPGDSTSSFPPNFEVGDESNPSPARSPGMRPVGTAVPSTTGPTEWSAAVDDVPPGHSAKFPILWRERVVEGFVVNVGGRYHAYVNYCVHAGTPLDWWPNEFFDDAKKFLVCKSHGSHYEPTTGKCAGGPCGGGSLFPLKVQVTAHRIIVTAPGE